MKSFKCFCDERHHAEVSQTHCTLASVSRVSTSQATWDSDLCALSRRIRFSFPRDLEVTGQGEAATTTTALEKGGDDAWLEKTKPSNYQGPSPFSPVILGTGPRAGERLGLRDRLECGLVGSSTPQGPTLCFIYTPNWVATHQQGSVSLTTHSLSSHVLEAAW